MKAFFDILGRVLAVVLVVVYAAMLINANVPFIPFNVMSILNILRNYGGLALIAIVGLEATAKWPLILKIIFYLLIALIVIFLFFPGTYANLIGMIKH